MGYSYLRRENQAKMPSARARPGMKMSAVHVTVRSDMGESETP